jgi:hypothetical protein
MRSVEGATAMGPLVVVQEGHVSEVTSSTSKLMPYRVYRVFTSLFRGGASVPLY